MMVTEPHRQLIENADVLTTLTVVFADEVVKTYVYPRHWAMFKNVSLDESPVSTPLILTARKLFCFVGVVATSQTYAWIQ